MEDGLQELLAQARLEGRQAGLHSAHSEGYPLGLDSGRQLGATIGALLRAALAFPKDPRSDRLLSDILAFPLENIEDPLDICTAQGASVKEMRLARMQARVKELSVVFKCKPTSSTADKLSF